MGNDERHENDGDEASNGDDGTGSDDDGITTMAGRAVGDGNERAADDE
jgi:hypothetical protein